MRGMKNANVYDSLEYSSTSEIISFITLLSEKFINNTKYGKSVPNIITKIKYGNIK